MQIKTDVTLAPAQATLVRELLERELDRVETRIFDARADLGLIAGIKQRRTQALRDRASRNLPIYELRQIELREALRAFES